MVTTVVRVFELKLFLVEALEVPTCWIIQVYFNKELNWIQLLLEPKLKQPN